MNVLRPAIPCGAAASAAGAKANESQGCWPRCTPCTSVPSTSFDDGVDRGVGQVREQVALKPREFFPENERSASKEKAGTFQTTRLSGREGLTQAPLGGQCKRFSASG